MITLSVLDQVPIFNGGTAVESVQESIALAQAAEKLGYRRFWLGEHHTNGLLACAAPEIMMAAVAAKTSRIRVGSGGVKLTHYSPFKVAETFRMLHTLFPNRIDLGFGRGAGATFDVTKLLNPHSASADNLEAYAQQVRDLIGFVENAFPAGHPYEHTLAMPEGPGAPDLWLLGASLNNVEMAASLGLSFCFAQFLNQHALPKAITTYRERFRPSASLSEPRASLAVRVICADTQQEAQQLALCYWLISLQEQRELQGKDLPTLTKGPARIPSLEDALCYPYTDEDQAYIRDYWLKMVAGDPMQVKECLMGMAKLYDVEELVILTTCPDFKTRLRCYELLAEAFELQPS